MKMMMQRWRPEYELDGINLGIGTIAYNGDISLIRGGRLSSSCVQSIILHGSETWPVRKENK